MELSERRARSQLHPLAPPLAVAVLICIGIATWGIQYQLGKQTSENLTEQITAALRDGNVTGARPLLGLAITPPKATALLSFGDRSLRKQRLDLANRTLTLYGALQTTDPHSFTIQVESLTDEIDSTLNDPLLVNSVSDVQSAALRREKAFDEQAAIAKAREDNVARASRLNDQEELLLKDTSELFSLPIQNVERFARYGQGVLAGMPLLKGIPDGISNLSELNAVLIQVGGAVKLSANDVAQAFREKLASLQDVSASTAKEFKELRDEEVQVARRTRLNDTALRTATSDLEGGLKNLLLKITTASGGSYNNL